MCVDVFRFAAPDGGREGHLAGTGGQGGPATGRDALRVHGGRPPGGDQRRAGCLRPAPSTPPSG